MNPADDTEDIEIESPVVRAARLTFLGSLAFWPLFLAATAFMLPPVGKTVKAIAERKILVDSMWLYPLAVGLAWFLCKRSVHRVRSDVVCLLPWLIPALIVCYWLVYLLVL
jgi:hypothetical protein